MAYIEEPFCPVCHSKKTVEGVGKLIETKKEFGLSFVCDNCGTHYQITVKVLSGPTKQAIGMNSGDIIRPIKN